MKIFFANPAYRIKISGSLERYFFCAGSRCPWSLVKPIKQLPRYSMFPFFMGYAAALLKNKGFEVDALDAVPLNLTENEFIAQVRASVPDVIVFEPVTTSIHYVNEIAGKLKDILDCKVVFCGAHITALPEDTLNRFMYVDYLLLGEYEFTLLNLIQSLEQNLDVSKISNLAYRIKNEHLINEKLTGIDNLNKLPYPARQLFPSPSHNDMNYYHDGFCQNRPAVQMHSSRGCPFRCSFCLWTQTIYQPGKYRLFSPLRIVDEMEHVIEEYNAREIYFDDDTFTGNKAHVLEICRLIKARKIKVPWSVMGDAMLADEQMIREMKAAGCIGIKFGLESASQSVLRNIRKPVDPLKLKRLLRLCNKLRIKTHVTVSFGHLGETAETISETIKFVGRLSADSAQFSIATPYPGTRFYKQMKEAGLLRDVEWEDYDPTHTAIIDVPGLSHAELMNIEASAHGQWLRKKLTQPGWVFRQTYFLYYLVRSQGMGGFVKRLKRGMGIIFSKSFR